MTINLASEPGVVRHRFAAVANLRIFYREAGPKDAPTLLLLHGFPSASHEFRRLIDKLAGEVHVVAPDYPGFGFSELPQQQAERETLATFENLSTVMEALVKELELSRFFMYVFDFGAPVGFRLATRHPEWISGIISQNGNMYEAGLGPAAERLRPGRTFDPDAVRQSFSLDVTRSKYVNGAQDVERIPPESWVLDQYFLDSPGRADFLVRLLANYPSNIELYPVWQSWLRQYRAPLLVAWGRHDPIFVEAGAHAFLADAPQAQIHLFESGHFALDERLEEYTSLIKAFVLQEPSRVT